MTAERTWPESSKAWWSVAVLTFAYLVSFVDRQVLSLLIPDLKAAFGISDTQASLLQGLSFGIFYTLLGLPVGRLADRRSRRSIIIVCAGVWAAMTAACGLARSFGQLFLARVGVGVGEAGLNPAALSMIADSFPPDRRATATGVYVAAGSLGGGLALVAGGAVIDAARRWRDHWPQTLGRFEAWQLVFVMAGALGLLAPFLMLFVREPARQDRVAGRDGGRGDLLGTLRERRVLVLLHFGGFALFSMAAIGILAWTPTLFRRIHGWSAADTGTRFGLVLLISGSCGSVCGGLVAGWLRRLGRVDATMLATAVGATALIPFAVAAPLISSAGGSLAMFGIALFFVTFPSGTSVAALQEVLPNELRGQGVALYYLVINLLGLGLGATSVALLTDRLYQDEGALARSLSVNAALLCPLAAVLIWASLPWFRTALARVAGEDG